MLSRRSLFLKHIAQTSDVPAIIDVARAEGVHIYDHSGKKYTDLSSGIGPNILGHRHPDILEAIRQQTGKYLHTMVYGEHIQSPQLNLAELLLEKLDKPDGQVYFLSSGSEAIEASIKVARMTTGRIEVISAANAYHGSTIGAESLRSDLDFLSSIVPLVPGTRHIGFNAPDDLGKITSDTAAVIMETIQAEAGVIVPDKDYMAALRKRCDEVGALLIFDEIQIGLGRSGDLFAFQAFDIEPDILVLGKALGGGLPLSAVISSKDIMTTISHKVPLAHLTTFGGHPLCCSTGLATLKHITNEKLWLRAAEIGQRFGEMLSQGPWKIRKAGAMIAYDVGSEQSAIEWANKLHNAGIVIDLLLFDLKTWRMAPPLTITDQQIDEVCAQIMDLVE
ncbi:MAG: aspartate aminotransferase family protein [Saprospiraceae bacterium]|nr:aspartate aminotransferase family protein [Saprospiraceae bacterium]